MLIAGLVLPASPFELWKQGKGNDVPVIIGMKHIILYHNRENKDILIHDTK